MTRTEKIVGKRKKCSKPAFPHIPTMLFTLDVRRFKMPLTVLSQDRIDQLIHFRFAV